MLDHKSDKYTFTMEHGDGGTITCTGDKEGIQEVLENFKFFLMGCSFHPDNVERIQYVDGEY